MEHCQQCHRAHDNALLMSYMVHMGIIVRFCPSGRKPGGCKQEWCESADPEAMRVKRMMGIA